MISKNIKAIALSVLMLGTSLLVLTLVFGVSNVKAAISTGGGASDGGSVLGASTGGATNLQPENTYALCHDGIDNDGNGMTDMGDRSCAGFGTNPDTSSSTPENTYALCHDGIDNDGNGNTDMADRSCAGFATDPNAATTTPPTTPANPPTVASGGGSSSGSYVPGFVLGTSTGSVLGASTDDSTSTCELFKTFMRKGNKYNNKTEVIKLQKFLNTELSLKLPITGMFGTQTEKAVSKFQVKYTNTVLTPWVKAGRMVKPDPTGFFFKTTQYEANKLICPSIVVDAPVLK